MKFADKETLKSVSIVIPVYNERENLRLVCEEVQTIMDAYGSPYDIIFVDDGSTDGSQEELRELADNPAVQVALLRRNYGQTAAMKAGIELAQGDYIVTMDGDLQNNPVDIPLLLEKLDNGFDFVQGWRKDRQDKFLSRQLPSILANKLIRKVTGYKVRDLGCTLKAMKAEIAKELELYGEMHRFIPILALNLGARFQQIPVDHRARVYGESKYNLGRSIRVLLDLITVQYMCKYFASPMKLFGFFGILVSLLAILSFTAVVLMKVFWQADVTGNGFTYISIASAILAVQFFSLGIIGELGVRIYYGTGGNKNFQIRELVNTTSVNEKQKADEQSDILEFIA